MQRTIIGLLLVSVAAATWISVSGNAYSESHVKRVLLLHSHELKPDGNLLVRVSANHRHFTLPYST